jgi:hypothetical protein
LIAMADATLVDPCGDESRHPRRRTVTGADPYSAVAGAAGLDLVVSR